MKLFKKIMLLLLVVFMAIQFLQPARNRSGQVLPTEFEKIYVVPAKVSGILKNTCYDCHSNNTHYPWYSFIQPGAWWMASHIKKGKAELNFNEFGNYSTLRRRNKLQSIINTINDGAMPIRSYTMMHQNAKLSHDDKKILLNWLTAKKDSL